MRLEYLHPSRDGIGDNPLDFSGLGRERRGSRDLVSKRETPRVVVGSERVKWGFVGAIKSRTYPTGPMMSDNTKDSLMIRGSTDERR